MAALLVAMAVMAVLMSVALPVWRHDAQREKEEELVFRGQQYIRAIRLFQARTQTFPTSIDMLVQGRYLRKKYKDPITNEDFVPIPIGGAIPGQGGQTVGRGGQPVQGGRGSTPAGGRTGSPTSGLGAGSGGFGASSGSGFSSGTVAGGMMGVVSKSKDESIRLYQGRNHYNEWTFLYVAQQPGGPGGRGGPGIGGRDGRGGRGGLGGGGTFGGRGGPGSGPGRGGPGAGPGRGGPGLPPIGAPGGIGRGRSNR
jgi:type II secretory pathway pseudopilin PulG